MTSPLSPTAAPPLSSLPAAPAGARWRSPAWLREPLLHFALLGGLLFGADHLLVSAKDDPRTIVVDAAVDAEAQRVFTVARGHAPDQKELAALRSVWLDNEVLYREGLALQVDRGDTAIRDRVIFKALSVIDANLKRPDITDPVLRDWFEAHRSKYDEPGRFDFQEAVLSGDSSEAAVRAFVKDLNAGTPGDARAGLRVFKGRPHDNLVQSYGADFAQALEASPVGEWRAVASRSGWHAMRLDASSPAKPASFEALRGVVLQDWTDAVMAEQRTAAVRALAAKYTVRSAGTGP